ncbi:rhodanese-related sulfurtransferase [Peptoniphilus ivorii]|uniref:rhodanese-like domain-containing protein n=1 Tax=Aedoeadaptatus ivorii TaxID=54006 RepID=UPI002789A17B|nr:rhodanese-like domain-containing protein [Peptoniphilus ivorii]MDQ0508113.1 rhodanese-related sulfurtransferase [Peptoniphilus ivorii]
MNKKINVAALALVLAMGLTACGQGNAPANNAANTANNTATTNQAVNTAAEGDKADGATETAEVKEMKGEELDKIEEDAKEKDKYLVIDVRSEDEYNEGHVKHAINMPIDEFESHISELEDMKDSDIVTICNSGKKSGEAAKMLVEKGFTKVHNAQGVKDFEYTTMSKVENVRGAEFQKLVDSDKYTVIDARDAKDFEKSTFEGAINVTPDEFDAKYAELPTDKPFAVFCNTGNRSYEIAEKLVEKNHEAINAIEGTKEYDGFNLK